MIASKAYSVDLSLQVTTNEVFELTLGSFYPYKDAQGNELDSMSSVGIGVLGNSDFTGGYLSMAEKHALVPKLSWLSSVDLGHIKGYMEKDAKSYFLRLNQGLRYKGLWSEHLEEGLGVYLWNYIFEDKALTENKSVKKIVVTPYYSLSFCF